MLSSTSKEEELEKSQKHLSLLRAQYVKLQEQFSDLQRRHSTLKAVHNSTNTDDTSQTKETSNDFGLAAGLLKLATKLYGSALYSDIEIRLKHRVHPGHKFVLAARSDKWEADGLDTLCHLDLQTLDSNAGEAVIKWIYTDSVDLKKCSDEFIIQLMKTAHTYSLKGLQTRCEHAILSTVNVRNCIQFYELAEEIGAMSLKEYCSTLVSMHWDDLTSDDFVSMAASILYTMFKSKSTFPLHRAIRAKREDVVFLYLIEHTGELPQTLNVCDENGDWPLYLALQSGQESIATSLVSHGVDLNGFDEDGKGHLHKAILAGDEFSTFFLLNNGCSVNCMTKQEGLTPLHVVSKIMFDDKKYKIESVVQIASLLLKKGANPNYSDAYGRTSLHLSIVSQNMPVFKVLLRSNICDLEIRTREGYVALWLALKQLASSANVSNGFGPESVLDSVYNDFSMAGILLQKGCQIDATDQKTGSSLMQLCAENLDEAGALFLAKHGASLNHLNFFETSCLHTSSRYGLVHLTEFLLTHGADPNVQTRKVENNGNKEIYHETPLHIAIRCQHYDVVRLFLERRADLFHAQKATDCVPDFNIKDSENQTVLALSVWSGFYKIAGQLLSSGADINYKGDSGKTLLHMAIEKQDISSTLFLLEHQADINIRTDDGLTSLHLAVKNHLSVIVDAVCLRGANMNIPYSNGDCALWVALAAGHDEIASTLVRHGCDTTFWSEGPEGCLQTLLHRAIDENMEDVACFLIKSGCDIDSPRKVGLSNIATPVIDGQSPIHMACAWGLVKILESLLKQNAVINAQDKKQNTPLHIAVREDRIEITRILLAHPSINLNLVDNDKKTPFATAMAYKNNKCAEAILAREPGTAEQMDKNGKNFLHLAILLKDLDSVLFLISVGSDVNSLTCDGNLSSPLHLAIEVNDVLILRNLLLAGTNIDVLNKYRQTALHIAAIKNEASMASVLIENGADANAVDNEGNNVFHFVAMHGCLECIQTLSQMVTNIQKTSTKSNNKSQNPLHLLALNAKNNAAPMFECLFAAVPDYPLDVQDQDGNTGLLLAYMNGHGALCRSLVRSGATLATSNLSGVNIFNHPVATKQLLFRLLDTLNQEPPWVEGSNCLECDVKFGVATRKHHCRHCGRLLCAKCSSKVMPIIKFDIAKPTRVCDLCYDVLTIGG
uniref:Ankyrin repeat and FYVE domain-containing protein 1 n=1 Tax=Phallusia mammillata TaxID=59560 RepID=A0A6F9D5U9_9ASCI|nr:ankyrin repeat and FYVE domain-containing protein 1 [Phallusia mammillata]